MTSDDDRAIQFPGGFRIVVAILWVVIVSGPAAGAAEVGTEQRAEDLRALLDMDGLSSAAALREAKARYDVALRASPDDPRVEYAYSLVLHRLFQSNEARSHLEKAAAATPFYFPARQGLIRDLIRARKYSDAREQIRELSAGLDADAPDVAEQASWIGRIIGAVAGPVGSDEARSDYLALDMQLRRAMPAAIEAAYDRGFHELQQEVEELQDVIDSLQQDADLQKLAATATIEAETGQRRAELQAQREDAGNTAQKWNAWVAEETRKIDGSLEEMEQRYDALDRSVTSQLAVVASLQLQSVRGTSPPTLFSPGGLVGTAAVINPRNLEQALLLSEQRLNLLYAAQAELSNRATQTLAGRKAVVAKYEQATGQAMSEAESLARWNKKIQHVEKRAKAEASRKPGQLVSLESRMRNISTYDPTNFDVERGRILAEFESVNGAGGT